MTPAVRTHASDLEALRAIRAWNDAALRRPGNTVIVVTPTGELDDHTRRQITTAEAAGNTVQYVTLPGRRPASPARPTEGAAR